MQDQAKLVLARCNAIFAKAMELYGLDLSKTTIRFDLKGRAAGVAGARGSFFDRQYYMRFNRDMMTREAFDHILNETVPHEIAHLVCFMNPKLGSNHDAGWARVCLALGGSGARTHKEEVVYGKGTTYEYTTDRGEKVRLSDRRHSYIQGGGVLTYRHGKGKVTQHCAYSIVGVQGRTLANPVVKKAPNHPAVIEEAVRAVAPSEAFVAAQAKPPVPSDVFPFSRATPVQAPATPAAPSFNKGESKASISRAIMLSGFKVGHTYEMIITAMIAANGYDRQLARATFKANAGKVGIPASFC